MITLDKDKILEIKDKVEGGIKETTGEILDDKEMELKGKFLKAKGKARSVARDVIDEVEDVRDKLVGSAKERVGKLTEDDKLQTQGQKQKNKAQSPNTNKIIGGLAALFGLYALKSLFKKRK